MNILFQFVIPPMLGALAGWAAAYLHWDVEKRRARLARRAALVDQWRRELLQGWQVADVNVVPPGGHPIVHRFEYASLRPHLSERIRASLEGVPLMPDRPGQPATVHVGRDVLRKELISEIARIEREWKLV